MLKDHRLIEYNSLRNFIICYAIKNTPKNNKKDDLDNSNVLLF